MEEPVIRHPEIEKKLLASVQSREASHLYIHCHLRNVTSDMLVRIWRTTFIVDKSMNEKYALVHAENISFAPKWTLVPEGSCYSFLLIFPSLPCSCTQFDLIEELVQPGGFYIPGIVRNDKDIYHLDIL